MVFIHPTEPAMPMLPGISAPVIDFTFDTARTAVQMTLNGVMSRHTRMKVILSHAGGSLPYVAHRVAAGAALVTPAQVVPHGLSRVLRHTRPPVPLDLPGHHTQRERDRRARVRGQRASAAVRSTPIS
ncbi:hypothetical protein ACFZB9_22350 [Kitasatospora sp. NPDC008050]|uniref:hypothetical protein n=1 Tax=Kitasatospora sp. NPDC008050 TaxID=3364021 RepID=UPI0036E86FF2